MKVKWLLEIKLDKVSVLKKKRTVCLIVRVQGGFLH